MHSSYNILIVDDVVENIQVAMNILQKKSYNFSFARSGEDALHLLSENNFDLILLDIMMPGIDGYEVCRRIKDDPRLSEIPIIFLSAKADIDSITKGFDVGGIDYITKPFHANELLARVKTHLEFYKAKKILEKNNLSLQVKMEMKEERILTELEKSQKEIIFVLTELLESVSDETGKHIHRVASYAKLFAHHHEAISPEDVDVIYYASPMHDIGKVTIPDDILQKKGPLTEEEFEIMKTHTSKAHEFLKMSDRKLMKAADIIAHQHHEKWNGEGYPEGLKGEEIHIYGRIVAISDVFDALINKRVYKEAWSIDDAVSYIVEHSGIHFDPYLVDIFKDNLDEFIAITKM